jgi:hypothetical protein
MAGSGVLFSQSSNVAGQSALPSIEKTQVQNCPGKGKREEEKTERKKPEKF